MANLLSFPFASSEVEMSVRAERESLGFARQEFSTSLEPNGFGVEFGGAR